MIEDMIEEIIEEIIAEIKETSTGIQTTGIMVEVETTKGITTEVEEVEANTRTTRG